MEMDRLLEKNTGAHDDSTPEVLAGNTHGSYRDLVPGVGNQENLTCF